MFRLVLDVIAAIEAAYHHVVEATLGQMVTFGKIHAHLFGKDLELDITGRIVDANAPSEPSAPPTITG